MLYAKYLYIQDKISKHVIIKYSVFKIFDFVFLWNVYLDFEIILYVQLLCIYKCSFVCLIF